MQVEQGVQYCEADLLPQGGHFEQVEEEGEGGKVMKTEMVYTSQGTHYVSENHEYIEQEQDATHLLTADGSFIDASSNHLVMSDGGLVSLVNCVSGDNNEPQEKM